MMEKIGERPPPSRILRCLLRLPNWLYAAKLGCLLGTRFVRLTHYGRRTGSAHRTVLEVVHRDKIRDTYYVVGAWGERSGWVRNITANPRVLLSVGRRRMAACAERVPPARAEEVMRAYGRRHPLTLRVLARFAGYRIAASEADFRALGRHIPIFALTVRPPPAPRGVGSGPLP